MTIDFLDEYRLFGPLSLRGGSPRKGSVGGGPLGWQQQKPPQNSEFSKNSEFWRLRQRL
jgi:hypothetical protein